MCFGMLALVGFAGFVVCWHCCLIVCLFVFVRNVEMRLCPSFAGVKEWVSEGI